MYFDGFRFVRHPAVIKRLLAFARIALASFKGIALRQEPVLTLGSQVRPNLRDTRSGA